MSQIHKSAHTKRKRKLTATFEIEKIMKSLKSEDARGYDEIIKNKLSIILPLTYSLHGVEFFLRS